MKTFRMTCDRFHFLTPLLMSPVVITQGIIVTLALSSQLSGPLFWAGAAVMPLLWVVLAATALMTPRAVTLTADELVIERFFWPPFRLPLSAISRVQRGPTVGFIKGGVRRLAGVGGWFWSGGLFWTTDVGRVRAWMTRLGKTVIVHRVSGLPILLGVDDVEGLFNALGGVTPA